MQTGTKISVAGHAVLASWVAFGAYFPSEPLPSPVQEVSLISAAEFERLSQQVTAPEVTDEPVAVPQPEPSVLPDITPPIAEPVDVTPPDPVPEPALDPELVERPAPEPEPEATIVPPSIVAPPRLQTPLPQVTEPQQQQKTERVAPVAVAPPPPDTTPDEVAQPAIAPDTNGDTRDEPQEATAPEAASDRIVTEENEGEAQVAVTAPAQSLRPRGRPSRPAPAPDPAPTPDPVEPPAEPDQPSTEPSAVQDALAEALAGGADVEAPEPSGPPLTLGEKDALRVAVSNCWNVGSLSSEALRTTVEVAVSLSQDGKPDIGSIRMIGSTGGSADGAKQAFAAARRAIIRCGARGFNLPPEKFGQWRDIEMVFNPERMRVR